MSSETTLSHILAQPAPPLKRKRNRKPKAAKPGELRAEWGTLPHCSPEICYIWGGSGANKCDSHLIHNVLSHGFEIKGGLLKELESRGYDITTLKFSIQQKPAPVAL